MPLRELSEEILTAWEGEDTEGLGRILARDGLASGPDRCHALIALANILLDQGNATTAAKHVSAVLKIQPRNKEAIRLEKKLKNAPVQSSETQSPTDNDRPSENETRISVANPVHPATEAPTRPILDLYRNFHSPLSTTSETVLVSRDQVSTAPHPITRMKEASYSSVASASLEIKSESILDSLVLETRVSVMGSDSTSGISSPESSCRSKVSSETPKASDWTSSLTPGKYQEFPALNSNSSMLTNSVPAAIPRASARKPVYHKGKTYRLEWIEGVTPGKGFIIAWDRPLEVHILGELSQTVIGWRFSVRSRPATVLTDVTLEDTDETRPFKISKVDFYLDECQESAQLFIPRESFIWKSDFYDEPQCKSVTALVEVIFESAADVDRSEVKVRFGCKNGDSITKCLTVMKSPVNYQPDPKSLPNIERYIPPRVPIRTVTVENSYDQVDQHYDKWTQQLVVKYPPREPQLLPNKSQLDSSNYKAQLHEALYTEESSALRKLESLTMVQAVRVSEDCLNCASKCLLTADNVCACIKMPFSVSEDTKLGRALLKYAKFAFLSQPQHWISPQGNPVPLILGVIVDKQFLTESERYGRHQIMKEFKNLYLHVNIPKETYSSYGNMGTNPIMLLNFTNDRQKFVEAHLAIDQIKFPANFFPKSQFDMRIRPPWYLPSEVHITASENRKRFQFLDKFIGSDLNTKQKEACYACAFDISRDRYPPILLTGPFGTGKTHTLIEAVRMILREDKCCRILVCVVSRNTGDTYQRKLAQNATISEDELLRIFSRDEDISQVDKDLMFPSANIEVHSTRGLFAYAPHKPKLETKKVVIMSLDAASFLLRLELPDDFFTHVFIDEAAQMAEFQLAPVLKFATNANRLVICGDINQLNPSVMSTQLEKLFAHSIVERFAFQQYTESPSPYKFELNVNYRSNVEILKFVYANFYTQEFSDQSTTDAPFPGFYPVSFISVRDGLEVNYPTTQSTFNPAEVSQVVKTVERLVKFWPKNWSLDNPKDKIIGIITNTAGQAMAVRDALSEEDESLLTRVDADVAHNLQGRQYRVVIVSTVKDSKSCVSILTQGYAEADLGFFSNPRLLCTAMTRARSLVITIGDPVALLLCGDCRHVWGRYLKLAASQHSLESDDIDFIASRVQALTLQVQRGLNPLSPSFFMPPHAGILAYGTGAFYSNFSLQERSALYSKLLTQYGAIASQIYVQLYGEMPPS